MKNYTFLVHETPYCVWGENLYEDNKDFIDRLDADYFGYIADVGENDIAGEDKQRSFILLRSAYTQGIETLFALIFSSIQSPGFIPGWMLRYQDKDLRELVRKLISGEDIKHLMKVEKLDLFSLSKAIHQLDNKENAEKLSKSFANAWKMFADDLLERDMQYEYNSIKHGLRTSGSPFSLVLTPNDSSGNPMLHSSFETGSEFSTSFFVSENVNGNKSNIYLRKNHHAWEVEYLINSLRIINISIMNIVNFINVINKYQVLAQIAYPKEGVEFSLRRYSKSSLHHFKIDPKITISNKFLLSKEKILEIYIDKKPQT